MEERIYEDEVETGIILYDTDKMNAEVQQGKLAGHPTAKGPVWSSRSQVLQ